MLQTLSDQLAAIIESTTSYCVYMYTKYIFYEYYNTIYTALENVKHACVFFKLDRIDTASFTITISIAVATTSLGIIVFNIEGKRFIAVISCV